MAIILLCFVTPLAGMANPQEAYPQADRGVFTDVSPRVTSVVPQWLGHGRGECLVDASNIAVFQLAGIPVKAYPVLDGHLRDGDQKELKSYGVEHCLRRDHRLSDRDSDGIPDTLDVMYGARKTVLNAALYGGPYQVIPYPNGDIDRRRGVCTDVVVRALRNAGYDLQRDLIRDMDRSPKSYRMKGRRPNRSIEHRRVRRQIVYFRRHFKSLPTHFSAAQKGRDSWLPGDIVFMDTLPKRGPDHVGIVSDRSDSQGRPLIINNWDDGYRTTDMELIGRVPVTHRFRITERRRSK